MRRAIIKFSMLIPVKLRQKREKKTNNVVTILQLLRLLSTLKHEFLFIMVLLMCVLNLDYFILNCMYTSLVSLQLTTTSSTTQLKIFILTCHNLTRCTIKVKYYLYSFIPCFQKQFNSIEIDFIFLLLEWMFCKQRVNKYKPNYLICIRFNDVYTIFFNAIYW